MVSAALLCALAIGSVGMPVYRPLAKDRSTPFPCQDHACGCVDAESCWRSCCCHTNAERLAWARKAQVTPPSYVVAAAAKETARSAATCCSSHGGGCAAEESPSASEQEGRFTLVLVSSYRKCQGFSSLWAVLHHALLEREERPTWDLQPSGEWIAEQSQFRLSLRDKPDLPPPRGASCVV